MKVIIAAFVAGAAAPRPARVKTIRPASLERSPLRMGESFQNGVAADAARNTYDGLFFDDDATIESGATLMPPSPASGSAPRKSWQALTGCPGRSISGSR